MTTRDYQLYVLHRGLHAQFVRAARILGVSVQTARQQTPYFRASELIAVAFYGSDVTRSYFVRHILPGRQLATGMNNPFLPCIGSWQGHGIFNLLPQSLKRDSGYDFFASHVAGVVSPGRRIN